MNSDNYNYTPETLSSLAAKYGVSTQTFKKWIKEIEDSLGYHRKRPFTPVQIKMIFNFLGHY